MERYRLTQTDLGDGMKPWVAIVALAMAFDVAAQDAASAVQMRASNDPDTRYVIATLDAIRSQWRRPADLPATAECFVLIEQRPGGEVVSARVQPECAFDRNAAATIEAAVIKASPLPYRDFESRFRPEMLLRFGNEDSNAPLASLPEPMRRFDAPPTPVEQRAIQAERDARLARIRAKRNQALRDAQDAKRRLYLLEISSSINDAWVRPDHFPRDVACTMRITQAPGGRVDAVETLPDCPYDEDGRRSVVAAVLRAEPLPYEGFESVFERVLTLQFLPRK